MWKNGYYGFVTVIVYGHGSEVSRSLGMPESKEPIKKSYRFFIFNFSYKKSDALTASGSLSSHSAITAGPSRSFK